MHDIKTKITVKSANFVFYILDNELNPVGCTPCRDSILYFFLRNQNGKLGLVTTQPEKLEAVLKHVNLLLDVENSNTYYDKENNVWFMDIVEFWKQPLRFSCLTGILKTFNYNTEAYFSDPTKEKLITKLQESSYFTNKNAISLFLNGHKHVGSYCNAGWWQTFAGTTNQIDAIISDKPIPYTEYKTQTQIWNKIESGFKVTPVEMPLAVSKQTTYYNDIFEFHKEDGPAIVIINKKTHKIMNESYLKHGRYHRENAPAVITYDANENITTETWYKNGTLHRDDGPAIKSASEEQWYKNGILHREDGPAINNNYGKYWYKNGRYHREDGPAIKDINGIEQWYKNGIQIPPGTINARN